MHMVRDEAIEHEPDIEDIDSTLERIDDRVVSLDDILPQELATGSENRGAETSLETGKRRNRRRYTGTRTYCA